MSRTEWFYSRVAQPSISVISGISEGMSERGGPLPRELPERPEMTRSPKGLPSVAQGTASAASLREMVLGTFD